MKKNDSLPTGCRSDLVNAVHADDPEAVEKCLQICSLVDRNTLVSEQAGKSRCPHLPWSAREAQRSRIKDIDNSFCEQLIEINNGNTKPENLPTLVFAISAKFGCVHVASMLLSDKKYVSDVDPTSDSNYALREASWRKHFDIVKLLISDDRVDPSAEMNMAIRAASANGHLAMVKVLLGDERVDPSAQNDFALGHASFGGYIDVVKLLMSDVRIDPSVNNNEAIRNATSSGKVPLVQFLLEDQRVDPSEKEQNAFQRAVDSGNIAMMQLLLADDRVVVTKHILFLADRYQNRLDPLLAAAGPRYWPRVIGNDVECRPRAKGYLREQLDEFEVESSWQMLMCVKRKFTDRVAARVGDVLREICLEWTQYRTHERPLSRA